MRRYDCLRELASLIQPDDLVVTTLAWTASEWAEVRPSDANFYQLNMGLCTPVAVGLALSLPRRRVIALDSDGSTLLSLGSLATLGAQRPPNLIVVIFDNEAYYTTGGLPSATAMNTDLAAVARGCGVPNASCAENLDDFTQMSRAAVARQETSLIVAKIEKDANRGMVGLGLDGREIKYRFVRYVERTEGIRIIRSSAREL